MVFIIIFWSVKSTAISWQWLSFIRSTTLRAGSEW